jgi:hypothetical protein
MEDRILKASSPECEAYIASLIQQLDNAPQEPEHGTFLGKNEDGSADYFIKD